MARVIITPSAQEDLTDIWEYVAEADAEHADKLLDRFNEKCHLLAAHPALGRARHELIVELRSFAVGNYVIFYQPAGDGIEVLRVLHGSRDVPEVFDEMIGR